jgi:hypothetical protein
MTSITSSATNVPPRPVIGVAISDSRLAREITEHIGDTASPLLLNHSPRVLHWSALTGVWRGLKFDAAPLYSGSRFHDVGSTPQYSSADERFEVDGANAERFSTVSGERGAAHAERDICGTAPTFFTEQGNWDTDTKFSMSPQAVSDV